MARFAERCGASIPTSIADRFAGLDDATPSHVATRSRPSWPPSRSAELAAHGVEHVHIYTLNRADLALAVCERLGVTIAGRLA